MCYLFLQRSYLLIYEIITYFSKEYFEFSFLTIKVCSKYKYVAVSENSMLQEYIYLID